MINFIETLHSLPVFVYSKLFAVAFKIFANVIHLNTEHCPMRNTLQKIYVSLCMTHLRSRLTSFHTYVNVTFRPKVNISI